MLLSHKKIGKRNIKQIILEYSVYFIVGMVFAFIVSLLTVRGNTLIGETIDNVLEETPINFYEFLKLFSGIVFLSFLLTYLKSYNLSKFSVKVQTKYKQILGKKLYYVEFQYFDNNGTATVINKMNADISEVDEFLTNTLPQICTNTIESIIYAIYIGQLNMKLLLLVVISYPIVLRFTNYVAKRLTSLRKQFRQKTDSIAEIVQDSISGILVLKAFGLEDFFQGRLNEAAQDLVENEAKRTRISNNALIIKRLLQWIPNIICVSYAYVLVKQGSLSIGELLVFILIQDRFVKAFIDLPFSIVDAKEHLVCIKRIEDILNETEETSGEEKTIISEADTIVFEKVSFKYENNKRILKEVSFKIPTGSRVAFVGESGGGKSTIFKIICGLYPVSEGRFSLFGRNYCEWNLQIARDFIALVSQNVFLFPTTIYENVRYGKWEASKDEIVEACKNAKIHEFIMGLPEKYDTLVGEKGILLSGGERQRISIARAFLKNAPILLLDEPTSAIDIRTEKEIQEAIDKLSQNKTCLTIAHRLSTIENADLIYVIKDGEIIENGTHSGLMNRKGYYFKLHEMDKI